MLGLFGGTFIAYEVTPQFAIIGADTQLSQEGNSRLTPADQYCKIIPLSDHMIFTSKGLDHSEDNSIDVAKSTRNSFLQTEVKDINDGTGLFVQYFDRSLSDYTRRTGRVPKSPTVRDNSIWSAYFMSANTSISFVKIDTFVANGSAGAIYNSSFDIPNLPTLGISEPKYGDFVVRMFPELSNWKITEKIREARDLDAPIHAEATRIQRIVEAIIAVGDPYIGGSAAVGILRADAGFRWFHQPEICK